MTTPAGTTSTTCDADSLPLTVADANSHATTMTYDANARLLTTNKANGDVFTNAYDATGKKGLLSFTTDGNSHTNTFYYTVRDQKSGVTYSDTYDNAGRLITVAYPHLTATSFSYDNANRQTGQTNANGSTVANAYDNANRTTDILHKTSANATLAHYAYAYDGVNNVTTRTDTDSTVTTFGYDNTTRRPARFGAAARVTPSGLPTTTTGRL